LRQSGLAAEISRTAQRGVFVLGICGGMQLLGREIFDPDWLEGGDGPGLGLLDVTTTLTPQKITRQREIRWNGSLLRGYEIHHGQTQAGTGVHEYLPDGLGWQQDNVYGVYLHGLFDNAVYRQQFLTHLGWSGQAREWPALVDADLERVARLIDDAGWKV
jgi:adenosylcobyric acid synthase